MYLIFFPPLPLPPLSFLSLSFPPTLLFPFGGVQISCLCLGVAETSCYLALPKISIKGRMFLKSLGSSLPEKAAGSQLRRNPRAALSIRVPPSRGSPPISPIRGDTLIHLPLPWSPSHSCRSRIPSIEAFEEEEEPYLPPLGWEEEKKKRGEKSVFKSNFISFYPRQLMLLDWELLLGSFRNLLLSM